MNMEDEMSTVKRFEDLHVWQSARELVKAIYRHTKQGGYQKDYGLRDQIQRAVISVMSNIAEGFGAGSDAEFVRFLGYARRSLYETQSQLYAALDLGYITQKDFELTFREATKIGKQINALIAYLARAKSSKSIREEPPIYEINQPDQSD